MRPPLAAVVGLGLINKKEEIIEEIIKKEKKFIFLNQLRGLNLNIILIGIN